MVKRKEKKLFEYEGIWITYRNTRELKKKIKKINNKLERTKKKEEDNKLKDWKLKVKERDGYTCQLCNKYLKDGSPINIQPHHIVANTKKFNFLSTDLNNGILLCSYCHNWSPEAPHHNVMYFTFWLMLNKREQYDYLITKLEEYEKCHGLKKTQIEKAEEQQQS
jgi:hypothetical protein